MVNGADSFLCQQDVFMNKPGVFALYCKKFCTYVFYAKDLVCSTFLYVNSKITFS